MIFAFPLIRIFAAATQIPIQMKESTSQFRLLIHCTIHQIREGFEANIRNLPFPVSIHYADLSQEGILSQLKSSPHLIVVLQHEGDSDYLLPHKIKLFARECPLLVVCPAIPSGYLNFLKSVGTDHIIQLPAGDVSICGAISGILLGPTPGKP